MISDVKDHVKNVEKAISAQQRSVVAKGWPTSNSIDDEIDMQKVLLEN
jgi:hypothetical protein